MASFAEEINEPVSEFFRQQFPLTFGLSKAGIVRPEFGPLSQDGGKQIKLRYRSLDATAPELDSGGPLSFVKGASQSELALITRRARAREEDEADIQALGSNPKALDEFAMQSVEYWAKYTQTTVWQILKAMFTRSTGILASTHCHDVAKDTGVPQAATRSAVNYAMGKLGDFRDKLTVMMCRSAVYEDLKNENNERTGVPLDMTTYEGCQVIIDDSIPTLGGSTDWVLYPTFFFAPGSIGLAVQNALKTQSGWWAATNAQRMVQSLAYAPHVFGTSFTGTPSDEKGGPTDTEFGTAGNYAKRTGVNDKDIRITCLLTNIRKRS